MKVRFAGSFRKTAGVAKESGEYWLRECPCDDQGLIRPLVAQGGTIVLLCDVGGEVWLHPADVERGKMRVPSEPDWTVTHDLSVRPGTTRWANREDLKRLDWDVTWLPLTLTR